MLTPVYSANAIADRITDIAASVNKEYKDAEALHVIVTLNGAFMFAADLLRKLKMPVVVHFAGTGSYSGSETKDLRINPEAFPPSFGNQPVLILEDIVDSGATINTLRTIIAERFASNIKVATLLRRQSGKANADYYGFTIPQGLFIVGFGMDMNDRYRELSDIQSIGVATTSGMC
jgi:hypoxanthine phosphoribosyltransferase